MIEEAANGPHFRTFSIRTKIWRQSWAVRPSGRCIRQRNKKMKKAFLHFRRSEKEIGKRIASMFAYLLAYVAPSGTNAVKFFCSLERPRGGCIMTALFKVFSQISVIFLMILTVWTKHNRIMINKD